MIEVRRVRSWASAKKHLEDFPSTWAFRGQADSRWPLETSLERVSGRWDLSMAEAMQQSIGLVLSSLKQVDISIPTSTEFQTFLKFAAPVVVKNAIDLMRDNERTALQLFQSRVHHYLAHNALPQNLLEWLALMQHHGAPTRLLDFTLSPYVAAFFGSENPTKSFAIWAVDLNWFEQAGKQRMYEVLRAEGVEDEQARSRILGPNLLDEVVRTNTAGVFPVRPAHLNERLSTQQGMFLALGNTRLSFMDNLFAFGEDVGQYVVKIEAPQTASEEALYDLNRMNISRASLFPGIDGFAQSIRQHLLLVRSGGQTVKQVKGLARRPHSLLNLMAQMVQPMVSNEPLMRGLIGVAKDIGMITNSEQEAAALESLGLGGPEEQEEGNSKD